MQKILKGIARQQFDALPTDIDEQTRLRHFTVTDALIDFLKHRRGDHNRLGIALHWCWLDCLGWHPTSIDYTPHAVVDYVAEQLKLAPQSLTQYDFQGSYSYEHAVQVRKASGWRNLGQAERQQLSEFVLQLATQDGDKVALLKEAVNWCRHERVVRPGLTTLEEIIGTTVAQASDDFERRVIAAVPPAKRDAFLKSLDDLIPVTPLAETSPLQRLKAPPGAPSANNLNRLYDNIDLMRTLGVEQVDLTSLNSQRCETLAREAMRLFPDDLRGLRAERRYALLICLLKDLWASHHAYTVEMHERVLRESRARAEGRRKKTLLQRLTSMIGHVRMLALFCRIVLDDSLTAEQKIARMLGDIASADRMREIIRECDEMANPDSDSRLTFMRHKHSYLRRFSARFVSTVTLVASAASNSAKAVMAAMAHLQAVDAGERDFEDDPPLAFLPSRWQDEIVGVGGVVNRRTWELAAHERLAEEIKKGTISVPASPRHQTIEADLRVSPESVAVLTVKRPHLSSFEGFKRAKTEQYYDTLEKVNAVIHLQDDVNIRDGRIFIARLDAVPMPPDTVVYRKTLYDLMQRRKMPQVMRMTLNWVDWAAPLRRQVARDLRVTRLDDILQAAIYAEGANLGLKNMADSTPGISYMQLARAAGRCLSWDALVEAHSLVFKQFNRLEIVNVWGNEEWSASDGMLVPLPMRAFMGRLHPKAPKGQRVVNLMSWLYDRLMSYSFIVTQTTAHESMHEFDGIFRHATGFQPRKHTTDTAGYSDLLFGTGALFDIFYVPIIKDFDSLIFYYLDIKDRQRFAQLGPVLKAKINWDQIERHWGVLMDYAATLEARIAPPSRLLSKLEAAGEMHDLHRALMNVGRLEKTIVGLSYAGFEDLRRAALRMHNKQEHHNSLKAQVFWANKGEMRLVADQDIQNRHACLELLSSLILLYNAVHLQAAWKVLVRLGEPISAEHLAHIFPTHTEHINFLGDFIFANARNLQVPMDKVVLAKAKTR